MDLRLEMALDTVKALAPFFDLAEENSRDRIAIELQLGIAGHVVGDDVRAGDRRDMKNFARSFGQIVVAHRPVGGAEINGLGDDLFLSAARADRRIRSEDHTSEL